MKRRTITPALGLALGLALIATGCAPGNDGGNGSSEEGALVIDGEEVADAALFEAAQKEGKVIVYSGAGEKSQLKNDEFFTEDTGIEVESINLSPARLKERILSEAGAGQFTGQVIIISDPSIAKELLDADVFAEYELPKQFGIDETVTHSGGKYYTAFYPSYSLAYNDAAITGKAPVSWADLLKPEYKGKLGIVNAGVGGSAAALTRFQLEVLGEDYLRKYAANSARVFDTMAAEAEAMGRGEVLVGSMTVGTASRSAEDGAPLKPFVPKEGFAVYDYFAALAANGADSAAAKVYMNWYFSKRGQKIQVDDGSYSVRTDIDPPSFPGVEMPPLDSKQVFRISPEEALKTKQDDLALWNKIFNIAG